MYSVGMHFLLNHGILYSKLAALASWAFSKSMKIICIGWFSSSPKISDVLFLRRSWFCLLLLCFQGSANQSLADSQVCILVIHMILLEGLNPMVSLAQSLCIFLVLKILLKNVADHLPFIFIGIPYSLVLLFTSYVPVLTLFLPISAHTIYESSPDLVTWHWFENY